MYDLTVAVEWIEFAVRWTHVITAMAWIGSSFYFIALDLGLNRSIAGPADGEEWQVHGGGFYHVQKYMVAPDNLPEHLVWFKWESYSTWLSGFALLVLVYYLVADLYLVDPNIADISTWTAVSISLASVAFGWIAYDFLCRSKLGEMPSLLMILLFALLTAMAWGYTQIFSGRAALLHLGAFTATIMSANVFMIIIPNQKIVVSDLKAGRMPDAKYGKIAKLRSTHNNYLTLPVIFLMLSNHYPLAFASDYNWLIAALIFLMGVVIRHYFNTLHAKKGHPNWTWLAATIVFIIIIALSTAPLYSHDPALREEAKVTRYQQRVMASANFDQVSDIVRGRCAMCHAREPVWEGILWPPKGVRLETPADVAVHARAIYVQSVVTHAMPPANVSYMEIEERRVLRDWYSSLK